MRCGFSIEGTLTRVRLRLIRDRRRKAVTIDGPQAVCDLLRKEARDLDRECFWRIDLDARNVAVAWECVSIGTTTAALVHPAVFFRACLLTAACGVIAVHNHVSLDPSPSPEDKATTTRLRKAGELLGIPLLDHVVLADGRFYSFREGGLL